MSHSLTHLEEDLLFKRDIQEVLNQVGKVCVRGLQNTTTGLSKSGQQSLRKIPMTFRCFDHVFL